MIFDKIHCPDYYQDSTDHTDETLAELNQVKKNTVPTMRNRSDDESGDEEYFKQLSRAFYAKDQQTCRRNDLKNQLQHLNKLEKLLKESRKLFAIEEPIEDELATVQKKKIIMQKMVRVDRHYEEFKKTVCDQYSMPTTQGNTDQKADNFMFKINLIVNNSNASSPVTQTHQTLPKQQQQVQANNMFSQRNIIGKGRLEEQVDQSSDNYINMAANSAGKIIAKNHIQKKFVNNIQPYMRSRSPLQQEHYASDSQQRGGERVTPQYKKPIIDNQLRKKFELPSATVTVPLPKKQANYQASPPRTNAQLLQEEINKKQVYQVQDAQEKLSATFGRRSNAQQAVVSRNADGDNTTKWLRHKIGGIATADRDSESSAYTEKNLYQESQQMNSLYDQDSLRKQPVPFVLTRQALERPKSPICGKRRPLAQQIQQQFIDDSDRIDIDDF